MFDTRDFNSITGGAVCSRLNVHCSGTFPENHSDSSFFCSYTSSSRSFGVIDYVTALVGEAGPHTPLWEDRVSELFLRGF